MIYTSANTEPQSVFVPRQERYLPTGEFEFIVRGGVSKEVVALDVQNIYQRGSVYEIEFAWRDGGVPAVGQYAYTFSVGGVVISSGVLQVGEIEGAVTRTSYDEKVTYKQYGR